MAGTTTSPSKEAAPVAAAPAEKKKPEKPNDALFEAAKEKAKKEHKAIQDKFAAIRAKIELAQPKKDGPPNPTQKKRQELQARLQDIRKEQAGGKAGRNQVFEQIKKLDEQLKSRIAEQKAARSRVAFKNVEEVDREIERLEKQVNGGMMKLVDEKKALTEVSNLRKQRKNFAGFEDSQKAIDDVKAKIKTLRDTLDDPVAKARSEEYNKLQAELDVIKAEQDEVYKNISALRDERDRLHKEAQAKYLDIRAIEEVHWQAKRAFQAYEYEQRQRLRERKQAEHEAYTLLKKRERAEKVLAEASEPAYLDEIRRAQSLVHYLDPSTPTEAKPLLAPSGLSAAAQRVVDDSGIKGMKVVKKEEEDYFSGTGGKKGKKGRKGAASPAAPAAGKFTLPPSVMEDCAAMGIEPPMSAADVPAVLEKVKEKLAFWKKDQKAQTEKNIAKAQKEIEKLDAEDSPAATNGTKKTDSAAETVKDAVVAEVTEKVKEVAVKE